MSSIRFNLVRRRSTRDDEDQLFKKYDRGVQLSVKVDPTPLNLTGHILEKGSDPFDSRSWHN